MSGRFQVDIDGEWRDYALDEDRILKSLYQQGRSSARLFLRGQRFEYDFRLMTERNLRKGTVRAIRLPREWAHQPRPVAAEAPAPARVGVRCAVRAAFHRVFSPRSHAEMPWPSPRGVAAAAASAEAPATALVEPPRAPEAGAAAESEAPFSIQAEVPVGTESEALPSAQAKAVEAEAPASPEGKAQLSAEAEADEAEAAEAEAAEAEAAKAEAGSQAAIAPPLTTVLAGTFRPGTLASRAPTQRAAPLATPPPSAVPLITQRTLPLITQRTIPLEALEPPSHEPPSCEPPSREPSSGELPGEIALPEPPVGTLQGPPVLRARTLPAKQAASECPAPPATVSLAASNDRRPMLLGAPRAVVKSRTSELSPCTEQESREFELSPSAQEDISLEELRGLEGKLLCSRSPARPTVPKCSMPSLREVQLQREALQDLEDEITASVTVKASRQCRSSLGQAEIASI